MGSQNIIIIYYWDKSNDRHLEHVLEKWFFSDSDIKSMLLFF